MLQLAARECKSQSAITENINTNIHLILIQLLISYTLGSYTVYLTYRSSNNYNNFFSNLDLFAVLVNTFCNTVIETIKDSDVF